jgi:hypothetical protein
MRALVGITTMKTSDGGGFTVKVVEELSGPEVPVIVLVPCARLLTKPWLPGELLMVATLVFAEPQVTDVVTFWVLPSVKVPMAVNCNVFPNVIEGLTGVRAMETKTGGMTVSVAEPLTEPKLAVIVVAPWPVLVAKPWLPAALLIAATAVFEELQVSDVVRSEMVPFLKKPVAKNCCFSPSGIEGFTGVTEIELSPETEPLPERLVT